MLGHVSVQTTERYLDCKQQYAKDLGRGKSRATTIVLSLLAPITSEFPTIVLSIPIDLNNRLRVADKQRNAAFAGIRSKRAVRSPSPSARCGKNAHTYIVRENAPV